MVDDKISEDCRVLKDGRFITLKKLEKLSIKDEGFVNLRDLLCILKKYNFQLRAINNHRTTMSNCFNHYIISLNKHSKKNMINGRLT